MSVLLCLLESRICSQSQPPCQGQTTALATLSRAGYCASHPVMILATSRNTYRTPHVVALTFDRHRVIRTADAHDHTQQHRDVALNVWQTHKN